MDRLTIKYDELFVPKKICTIDRFGKADDCNPCDTVCDLDCGNCVIQECFTRLGDYEDTGLTTEQIRELKERDKSKPPIYQVQGDEWYEQEPEWWMCPSCEEVYDMDDDYDFCPNCGQRILR